MKRVLILIVCISVIVQNSGVIIWTSNVPKSKELIPMANLTINKSLDRYEVTFCVKFHPIGSLESSTIFWANTGQRILALFLNLKDNYGFGFHGNNPMIFSFPIGAVWPSSWFHLCFTCNRDNYHIVVNGKIWDSNKILNNKNDNFDETFVEQITIGSRYTGYEIFNGKIEELNIWNNEMSLNELKTLTSNCNKMYEQPNILKWSTISKNQISLAENIAVKFDDDNNAMCSLSNKSKLKLILSKFDYEGAKHICEIMKAKLYLPSKTELEQVFKDSKGNTLYKKCIGNVIVPLYLNDDGNWVEHYSKKLLSPEMKFASGEPNGAPYQRCIVMKDDYTLADIFCFSKMCPICKWMDNPVFILKGLCPQSKIEHRYVLSIREVYRGMLVFQGFTNKYYIAFHRSKMTWVILRFLNMNNQTVPINDDNIYGELTSSKFLPIGLQKWKIKDEACTETVVQLKLTSVILLFKIPFYFHYFKNNKKYLS